MSSILCQFSHEGCTSCSSVRVEKVDLRSQHYFQQSLESAISRHYYKFHHIQVNDIGWKCHCAPTLYWNNLKAIRGPNLYELQIEDLHSHFDMVRMRGFKDLLWIQFSYATPNPGLSEAGPV